MEKIIIYQIVTDQLNK